MKPLFIYDLETGGTDSGRHAVLQISALVDQDGEVVDTYDSYIQPYDHRDVDDGALEVTGIERDEIEDFPLPADVFEQLHTMLSELRNEHGPAVPVAYNAGFDRAFMEGFWADSLDEQEGDAIGELLDREAYLDPYPLFNFIQTRSLPEDNRQLGTVAEFLDIEVEGDLHDAQTDTQLCRDVLRVLMQRMVARTADPTPYRKVAYLDVRRNGEVPYKVCAMLQVDGEVVDQANFFLPDENGDFAASMDPNYRVDSTKAAKQKLEDLFTDYIDQYESSDKFVPIGYNCKESLEGLHSLWAKHDDPYIGSFLHRNRFQDPEPILNCLPYAYDQFGDRDATREDVYEAFVDPQTVKTKPPFHRVGAAHKVINRLRTIYSANAEPQDDNPFDD